MGAKNDWLGMDEPGLLALIAVWLPNLASTALRTAFKWPDTECVATISLLNTFEAAAKTYAGVPLKSNRIMKDEAKVAAKDGMRKFAAERIRNNPAMTDGEKEEMGVRTRDPKPSPIPKPLNGPRSKAIIDPESPGAVRIRFLGAKPYGVDRIEIGYAVSAIVITSPEEMTHFETFSRNPWEKVFPAAQRGETMYYSLRYLTKEGASLWTEVHVVIIP